jgi:hypothetical protein
MSHIDLDCIILSDKDGIISPEEYVRGEIFMKLLLSLQSCNDDGDVIMDKPELTKWLSDTLGLDGDMYTDAVLQEFVPKDAKELPVPGK